MNSYLTSGRFHRARRQNGNEYLKIHYINYINSRKSIMLIILILGNLFQLISRLRVKRPVARKGPRGFR